PVLHARRSIRPRNLMPSRPVARAVRLAPRSLVPSLPRQTRALVAIAAGSFLTIVLAYLLVPADRRALVADVSWTWAAAYAVACCTLAARRHPSPDQRRAWLWIGAGCVLFLGGQLVWSYYELIRRVTPPYPSLADAGYLGVYVCFLIAVTNVVYAAAAWRGTFRSGGALDLGWDAGLLLLASAAAVAPAARLSAEVGARAISGNAARITALVIGLGGIGAVAIRNALSREPDTGSAGLIALAVVRIGLRPS